METFGTYALLKLLGQGAAGSVYLARVTGSDTPVVIKRLHPDRARNPEAVQRFRHEAEVARYIEHPNVARVYDSGVIDDTLFIAMEYVSGWTLAKVLDDVKRTGAMFSVAGALELFEGILKGLEAIHGAKDPGGQGLGLVHRDLSPRNVIVRDDGHVKLIDLGLGKSKLQDWHTRTGLVMGSPGYMAPEQVFGRASDHATDLYCAGVILFELLTLEPWIPKGPVMTMLAKSAEPQWRAPSSLRPELPPGLDDVLATALAIAPERRFPSARAFLSALEEAYPERTDRFSARTVVGEGLWSELSETRIEVNQLLTATSKTEASATLEPTDVRLPPTRLTPRPQRRWQGPALTAVLVVGAAMGGAAWERAKKPTQNNPLPAPQLAPPVVPQVQARPRAPELATENVPIPVVATEKKPIPKPEPKPEQKVDPKVDPKIEAPAEASAPEGASRPTVAERVQLLTARARRLPDGGPWLSELQLVGALERDPERAHARLDALEAKIAAAEGL